MDYKKKYTEALERAKNLYEGDIERADKEFLESLFPELGETKEDKIRNALIDLITTTYEGYPTVYGIPKNDVLDFLKSPSKALPCWKKNEPRAEEEGVVLAEPYDILKVGKWYIDLQPLYDNLPKVD